MRGAPRWRRRLMWTLVAVVVAAVAALTVPGVREDAGRLARYHLGDQARRVEEAVTRMVCMRADLDRLDEGMRDLAPETPGGVVSGHAWVVDGDTLEVGWTRVRIRLHGIDAPESEQQCWAAGQPWDCGREATLALERRIGPDPVACEERDRDRYGRVVAVCRLDGRDVNAWMVAQGWALAYRRYSMDYVDEEGEARAAKRGVWRGELVAPWDWRRGVRREENRLALPPDERWCGIKGNISRATGERIYHVPGGEYYDATVVDIMVGERWFCTEDEARDAGWRRSRR